MSRLANIQINEPIKSEWSIKVGVGVHQWGVGVH